MTKKLIIEAKLEVEFDPLLYEGMSEEDVIKYYSGGDGFEYLCTSSQTILIVRFE